MIRGVRTAAVVAAIALTVAGCGFRGMYDLPLPGGADVGNDPYNVTVHFADALDLVQQANVKLNDVPIGKVDRITVAPDNWSADVTLRINRDVRLPKNVSANLVQSSLLGEKFVELVPPKGTPAGTLVDGDTIPLAKTDRYPEVEELLGALSMLLNGGGVGQLRTIAREVNDALNGNESEIKDLLGNLDHLVGTLDAQRDSITGALDSLDRLTGTLNAQRDEIDNTLDHLGPGLQVLADQRRQLVTMLTSLDRLSGVATDTIAQGRDDIVADLESLEPTLRKLTEAGAHIPRTLEVLLTFPFTDRSLDTMRGDYTNIDVTLDFDLDSLLRNLTSSSRPPAEIPDAVTVLPLPLTGRATGEPPTPSPQDGLLGGLLGGGR